MKLLLTRFTFLTLTSFAVLPAKAADLETTTPVEAKTNDKNGGGETSRGSTSISKKFLQPEGTISQEVMKEFLPLTPKSYFLWTEAIREKVKELMDDAKPRPKTPAKRGVIGSDGD